MHYLNIGVAQPGAQRFGKLIVCFNRGQARHCGSQTVRRKARARTCLEEVRPKLGAGENPWHPPLKRLSPTSGTTEPVMKLIHMFTFQTIGCYTLRLAFDSGARFRYYDNECR